MARKIVMLTDGYSDAHTAKTAISVMRYRPEEVVSVLDADSAGRTAQEVFGVGGSVPVVASLETSPPGDTLMVGIAPPGGKIPPHWRPIVLEAIRRKMNVVSGLHDFLNDDAILAAAAKEHEVALIDVRDNDEHDVANREGIREPCLRLHTVANECSCGKMVASIELTRGLQEAGVDAKFVATGQTGIMIEGDGCPVDRVISDFVSGAAEKLVLNNQHHEAIVVEGQGSLFHPRYSGVTLGLLHGVVPDGLILCYEMGRERIYGMEQFAVAPLDKVREFYEAAANIMHPCKVIAVAINGAKYSDEEVEAEREKVVRELGLPACDVFRHGPGELVRAALELKQALNK